MSFKSQLSPMRVCDWTYKAEGAANVVWSYAGDEWPLQGAILRLAKRKHKHPHEREPGVGESLQTTDPLEHVRVCMRPILGAEFVIPGERVAVEAEFVRAMAVRLAEQSALRPLRRHEDELDVSLCHAVVMRDHTQLCVPGTEDPTCTVGEVTFCVELKPKSGKIPPPGAPCRYCAHQVLKACELEGLCAPERASGEGLGYPALSEQQLLAAARHVSRYCPLDLYSCEEQRMLAALHALVKSPQNNLRLFVNGQLACSGEDCGGDSSDQRRFLHTLEAELRRHAPFSDLASTAAATDLLCSTVVRVLLAESALLRRLQAAQSADGGGLAHAWSVYERLAQEAGSVAPRSATSFPDLDVALAPAYAAAASAVAAAALRDEASSACCSAGELRSFLTAASAKDCSIMITFRASVVSASMTPVPTQPITRPPHSGSGESGGLGCSEGMGRTFPFSRLRVPVPSSVLCTPASPSSSAAAAQAAVAVTTPAATCLASPTTRTASPSDAPSAAALDVMYSVAVVDLDPKPLARLPHYVLQEQEIAAVWTRVGHALCAAMGRVPSCMCSLA
jgi:hypothetical protein